MSFDTKFEAFWVVLNQSQYELPEELKPCLKESLQKAGFDVPVTLSTTVVGTGVAIPVATGKKLTGYNVYMREKMAELKLQGVPSGERMGKVAAMWKLLTDAEKVEWKVKAGASSVAMGSLAVSKGKKLNGYNVFMKEMMAILKLDASIPAGSRMGEIGKRWKALSDAEKGVYKVKAAAM
jgi:hypothetical protein